MTKRGETTRITLSALLLALMLILGYVESLLPLNAGIPGIKLGLSNSVLIFAVYMLDGPTAFLLMAMKVLLSGMLFSGPSTMLYGFAGGLLSMVGMAGLHRIRRVPLPLVSVVGGMLHNVGQVGMSLLILQVPLRAMVWYLLVLLAVGAACGLLTGVCAQAVIKHLHAFGWHGAPNRKISWRTWVAIAGVVVLAGGFCLWQAKPWSGSQSQTAVMWEIADQIPAE